MPSYVYEGPRWFRSRIRSRGPFLALVPPAILGAIALLALEYFEGKVSGYVGLIFGVFAAPGLLAVGVPFSGEEVYAIGITLSVLLWLIVGAVAARRATRNPMASWTDFWRTYWWLAGGIWVGAAAALVVARISVGGALGRRSAPAVIPTTSGRIASNLAGPMPRTASRSSTEANGPLASRWSTIACAVAGPMPGSRSSSAAVARLRSTGPAGTEDEAAPSGGGAGGGGTDSPTTGT